MIPILVRLTGKQKTGLENLSAQTGASQAFLIRKAVDEYLARKEIPSTPQGSLTRGVIPKDR